MRTLQSAFSTSPCNGFDSKTASFMTKVMQDMGGAVASFLCVLGIRLGLFRELITAGPVTSGDLARRTGLKERYVREWLSSLAAAGYLDHLPKTGRFLLPVEHASVLAQEGGPLFLGCAHLHLPGLFGCLDGLMEVFRRVGGIRSEAGGEDWVEMERISAESFDSRLVQEWIPRIEGLQAKLKTGADVAFIGCASGCALIGMARTFPRSRFVGYEFFGPFISRATANAEAAGVRDRVRFEQRDVREGLRERYDLITSFDALCDISDPMAMLRAIRAALNPGGIYLVLEIRSWDKVDHTQGYGPLDQLESKLCKLAAEAGFRKVVPLSLGTPFNVLYGITLEP